MKTNHFQNSVVSSWERVLLCNIRLRPYVLCKLDLLEVDIMTLNDCVQNALFRMIIIINFFNIVYVTSNNMFQYGYLYKTVNKLLRKALNC